jgi:Xaa-Pro aminopeptidase
VDDQDVCFPISRAELARRHAAVRAEMERLQLDALLMQNSNDFHGGYVKWFSDTPAVYGGYLAVLFPIDAGMTIIGHGPPVETVASESDRAMGIDRIILRPTFAAVDYAKGLQAEVVAGELRKGLRRRVGLVGVTSMSAAFLDGVRTLSGTNVEFVDATEAVDRIKAVKSDEELELIRRCAALQDEAFDAVLQEARPGVRAFELTALAQYVGQKHGSEQGLFLAGVAPVGAPRMMAPRRLQNTKLEAGSALTILIENNGPGGFYCELGRTIVLGEASRAMKEDFAFAAEAQRHTLDLLRPGARPADILKKHNAFMIAHGRPEERRLYAHAQGYDLVERPMIAAEETIDVSARMNFAVHPTFLGRDALATICDNYIVGETGAGECLHRTPKRIFEV